MDDNGVDQLLTDQKPLEWILHAFRGGKYEVSANTTYEEDAVEPILKSLPFMSEANMVQPRDAALQETADGYRIAPEVEGNAVDEEKVILWYRMPYKTARQNLSLVDQALLSETCSGIRMMNL